MNNLRLFLWLGFFTMLWLNYAAWTTYFAPEPPRAPASTEAPPAEPRPDDTLPEIIGVEPTQPGLPNAPPLPPADPETLVRVRTDVLDVFIDTRGGDLVRVDLPQYPVDKDVPDVPVRLLDYTPNNRWVFETGLRTPGDEAEPNHRANWRPDRQSYTLERGQDELVVTLEWEHTGPSSARKIYTFRRGAYTVDLDLVLENDSGEAWQGAAYAQMVRLHRPPSRSLVRVDTYSFRGPVLYDGTLNKLSFDDIARQPETHTLEGGWFAGIQHHFLAAAVPPPTELVHYRAATRGEEYVLTAMSELRAVPDGARLEYPFRLFVGPKLQDQLAATADRLERAVDYGVLAILAQPMFWLLSRIHSVVGNWGWSIVIVTLLIKLAFYKLTQTSGRSMAKMRQLAPRLKALQERYKDDRQKLSQAMMDLYRREKVNPAAGCLPILIQMPFFFAFYWVLLESVEMRQAPFMLWIDDLSTRDPYFVLPLLMGAAMFIQMRLNPAPPDPMQARIMQIMPIVFTVFFALFPAGLVLYWLTNTVLSMAQQWHINKTMAAQSSPASS
jgi:YidC/Oxa1 family membrane protein insertase